jgi:hypothetical protein
VPEVRFSDLLPCGVFPCALRSRSRELLIAQTADRAHVRARMSRSCFDRDRHKAALTRGMQGFQISAARHINRALGDGKAAAARQRSRVGGSRCRGLSGGVGCAFVDPPRAWAHGPGQAAHGGHCRARCGRQWVRSEWAKPARRVAHVAFQDAPCVAVMVRVQTRHGLLMSLRRRTRSARHHCSRCDETGRKHSSS